MKEEDGKIKKHCSSVKWSSSQTGCERVLTLKNAPAPSLFNAINRGGQLFQVQAQAADQSSLFCQETPPALLPPPSVQPAAFLLSIILAMALESVPTYLSDLGSPQAARAQQQRIRKDERIWTSETYAPYDDGHQWRKYGEKKLSNSNFPRFYYRCTYKNDMKCPATKQVQQKDTSDPPLFSVTYFNHHTCSSISNPTGSTRDIAAQSASGKAVSICFSPHSSRDEPQCPSIHSFRSNQQPERSTYATSQFQWTATSSSPTSNSAVKMEVDSFSGARASSSNMGSLPRTLLPIGQSRCIEYFHFL